MENEILELEMAFSNMYIQRHEILDSIERNLFRPEYRYLQKVTIRDRSNNSTYTLNSFDIIDFKFFKSNPEELVKTIFFSRVKKNIQTNKDINTSSESSICLGPLSLLSNRGFEDLVFEVKIKTSIWHDFDGLIFYNNEFQTLELTESDLRFYQQFKTGDKRAFEYWFNELLKNKQD